MAENPSFGPFPKGVNNVDRSRAMAEGELVLASNLDIDSEGTLSMREGYALALAAAGAHSLWGRDDNTAFYVAGADMKRLAVSGAGVLSASAFRSGAFQAGQPVSYVLVNGDVFYSNGLITGRIRADNTSHTWGVEKPSRAPVLTAGAGNLPAGWYLVGLQFMDALGEVGGMTQPVAIQLAANSSIVVSSIPAAVSADVDRVSVYVTQQNGDILYRHGDYAAGTTSVTVGASATRGRTASGLFSDVMPPTKLLEQYNGRIYGAIDNIVFYTDALNYGQCTRSANFLLRDAPVTVLKAVNDGLYVGDNSKVMFWSGADPSAFSQRVVLNCGANPGAITLDDGVKSGERTVAWLSERGVVKGKAGGQIDGGDKDRVAVGMFWQGSMLYRETGDFRQVVTAMSGGIRSAVVCTDYADAEVRRNGVLI